MSNKFAQQLTDGALFLKRRIKELNNLKISEVTSSVTTDFSIQRSAPFQCVSIMDEPSTKKSSSNRIKLQPQRLTILPEHFEETPPEKKGKYKRPPLETSLQQVQKLVSDENTLPGHSDANLMKSWKKFSSEKNRVKILPQRMHIRPEDYEDTPPQKKRKKSKRLPLQTNSLGVLKPVNIVNDENMLCGSQGNMLPGKSIANLLKANSEKIRVKMLPQRMHIRPEDYEDTPPKTKKLQKTARKELFHKPVRSKTKIPKTTERSIPDTTCLDVSSPLIKVEDAENLLSNECLVLSKPINSSKPLTVKYNSSCMPNLDNESPSHCEFVQIEQNLALQSARKKRTLPDSSPGADGPLKAKNLRGAKSQLLPIVENLLRKSKDCLSTIEKVREAHLELINTLNDLDQALKSDNFDSLDRAKNKVSKTERKTVTFSESTPKRDENCRTATEMYNDMRGQFTMLKTPIGDRRLLNTPNASSPCLQVSRRLQKQCVLLFENTPQ